MEVFHSVDWFTPSIFHFCLFDSPWWHFCIFKSWPVILEICKLMSCINQNSHSLNWSVLKWLTSDYNFSILAHNYICIVVPCAVVLCCTLCHSIDLLVMAWKIFQILSGNFFSKFAHIILCNLRIYRSKEFLKFSFWRWRSRKLESRRYKFSIFEILNFTDFQNLQDLRFSWRWVIIIWISFLRLKFV